MDNLYWLEQIQPSDRSLVGNKAFYLSRVAQLGYPVPSGFVITAHIWRQFLEMDASEPLIADLPNSSLHLDIDNTEQLQQVAQRLRQEITAALLPSEWIETLFNAVKSWHSALIFRPSLAIDGNHQDMKISGLLEAQVCSCDQEAIALALKQTWSQLFRARSLLYWQRMGVRIQQINLAVLVQPLVNALSSGSLTYSLDRLEIKASWGLGIAIKRGEVLPDSYFVQPKTMTVQSQQLGNKTIAYGLVNSLPQTATPSPVSLLPQPTGNCLQTYLLSELQQQQYALKDEYLQELSQLAVGLSTELGSAFSLEWVLSYPEDGVAPQLYLTQVDTHYPTTPLSHSTSSQAYLIKGLAAAAGRVVAPAYVIAKSQRPEVLPSGVILVAPVIAPDWLPLLQQVVGIVTEQGGLTSHSAILAREMGIPAVVSAAKATQLIQNGESVILDGDRGEVYRVRIEAKNIENPNHPIISTNPHQPLLATQLMVNLSQPNLIERLKDLPVDGIGLLRSELMALTLLAGQHPNTWLVGRKAELLNLWQEQIMQFARAFAPRPVFYRSLDWRSHEFQSLTGGSFVEPTSNLEMNPMLGQRGTFSYLQNPQLFELELAALAAVQQSGYTNLRLILPFVRTVEEFSFCRRLVEQAGLTQSPQFQLWIMAEVPSVLFLIPEYVAAGVQGISIGTNDLTQLLLGFDREQGRFAKVFNEQHPVVMQAIAQLIRLARQANIPCSICGQAPALYPELIDSLIKWGITSISVELEAVNSTYAAIARAEQRLVLEAARHQLG